jgi:hypothetical protein
MNRSTLQCTEAVRTQRAQGNAEKKEMREEEEEPRHSTVYRSGKDAESAGNAEKNERRWIVGQEPFPGSSLSVEKRRVAPYGVLKQQNPSYAESSASSFWGLPA